MPAVTRPDQREYNALRPVHVEPDFAAHALGSALISFGNTRVICSALIENRVPPWMIHQKVSGGWITAEYSMLPYSTLERKSRDSSRGKVDGRTIEIQRLIGRSLRAVIDLQKLPGKTLWVDCDVLQADGGTRTASITGAYIAAKMAVNRLITKGTLSDCPFTDSIAAVSAGIYQNQAVLDLNYLEDKDATVDFNMVMTGSGQFVELQGSGEEATFSDYQLQELLALGRQGIRELTTFQNKTLSTIDFS